MSNATDLFGPGGGKPKLITSYTSGTGTYVPTVDMARCLVRIQAGGGGGFASAGSTGGGGGAMVEAVMRIPIAGLAYVVGTGGAVGAVGSASTFGQMKANPGTNGSSSYGGWGGLLSMLHGSVSATTVTAVTGGAPSGVGGGGGGTAAGNGELVGFAGMTDASATYIGSPASGNLRTSNGVGNSSGGNSFYGKGNPNNTAPAATAYGAGGGANAAGSGGYIEIWDMGA